MSLHQTGLFENWQSANVGIGESFVHKRKFANECRSVS